MRWLALVCCSLLLCTLFVAPQAHPSPPPKPEPPDEKTAELIKDGTEDLRGAVDRIKKLGVRDPNLADVEIFLRAAQRIVEHNEFYENGGKQTLAVLDQG